MAINQPTHSLEPPPPADLDALGSPREWLTVEQSADYLQLSQSSIRSYIRQGRLDARRIAGKRKVLIHRSELLRLLEPARLPDLAGVPPEAASAP
jgi:excisionase family DNA binding protein